MINIKPGTYNEALRLANCVSMRSYIPGLTDEKIEEMYVFLSADPLNRVYITPEMLTLVDSSGKTESATAITENIGRSFERITMGATVYSVVGNIRSTSSSGCSGCSGCSSNNNNNNNNNNG